LYDFQTGTNLLVSRSSDGASAGDGNSDSVEISSDGRFVAYRSAADNLVPGDLNGQPDLFLFDRSSGTTTLITASRFGNTSANNRSLTPVFSADGRTLVFASWASDLLAGDFNNSSDVFALGLYSTAEAPPFALTASAVTLPTPGNWLNWTVAPGKSYRVEFKDSLGDPTWQELNLPISAVGDRASVKDATMPETSRFYRVVAY
jgi:hypothetical protein